MSLRSRHLVTERRRHESIQVVLEGQTAIPASSVLICRGVPPWAPHSRDLSLKKGRPTEGRPYKLGHTSQRLRERVDRRL